MKKFEEDFRNDLWFPHQTVKQMDAGDLGNGYVTIPAEKQSEYELVPRAAFNPIVKISENEYETCWIFK